MKSNNASLTAAVIVLSIMTIILIIAVITMAIVIVIYKRKLSVSVSNEVIFESPDNIKEESFHMTQSSVYEVRTINK